MLPHHHDSFRFSLRVLVVKQYELGLNLKTVSMRSNLDLEGNAHGDYLDARRTNKKASSRFFCTVA